MATLEPFRHERCTAFKERVEIANKVNEVIDYINDEVNPFVEQYESVVETVENHTEEIESLEDDFNTLNTSISDLEDTVDTIDNDIDSVRTTVNGIQSTINGIQGNVHSLINDVDDIETNIEDLQNTTTQNTSDIETLDENTVKKTGDETISGNKTFTDTIYADDVNTKALTVHGDSQMLLGTVALHPNSQGGRIGFTDIGNRTVQIIQGHDSNDNCYLRQYPNNYYPVDSNNNPVAPANDIIMTSGLIGVDPRITSKASIDYVDEKISDVQNAVDKITDEWMLVPDGEFGSIFVNYKPTTDLILKLQLSLNNPPVYGTELFYLPKGVLIATLPKISRTIRTSSTSIDFVEISCPLNVLNVYNYSTIDTSRITLDLSNSEVTITTDQIHFGKQSDAGSSGNFVNIYRRKTVND